MASKDVPHNEFQKKPLLIYNSLNAVEVKEWTNMDKKARNIMTENVTNSVVVIF